MLNKFSYHFVCIYAIKLIKVEENITKSRHSSQPRRSCASSLNNPESNDPIDSYFIKVVLWFNPLRDHASYVKPNFLFNLFYFIQNLRFYHQAI